MSDRSSQVHRMFELVEPIATVTFSDDVTRAFAAHGMRGYWDGYVAGRAAPLGLAPSEVVHAVFYNFADGEVARHVPRVWEHITPEEALAVREEASAAVLRRRLGGVVDAPGFHRVTDLVTRAAVSAPTEGRPRYAGLRALDVPRDPVARLWHAATLLREHRGDSHNAVLVAHGIGGTEAHVLTALHLGERPEEFSRLQHLPSSTVDAAVGSLRARGLVDDAGGFTAAGRDLRARIETLTDTLAAQAYEVLTDDELDELVSGLERFVAAL